MEGIHVFSLSIPSYIWPRCERAPWLRSQLRLFSSAWIHDLLARHWGWKDAKCLRDPVGRPYVVGIPTALTVSIAHSFEWLFVAFSNRPVGIDAELKQRKLREARRLLYRALPELDPSLDSSEVLRAWVAKESALKCLGLNLAQMRSCHLDVHKQIYQYQESSGSFIFLEHPACYISVAFDEKPAIFFSSDRFFP